MLLDLGTQTFCLGTDNSILFYFTTCLERVLLQGGGGGYHFPLLKNTSSFSWCISPALGVLVFLTLKWASQVWSPMRWQSPKRPTSELFSPRQIHAPCIGLWSTKVSLCASVSIFRVQTWMWPFVPQLSFCWWDKDIFILCLVYLNVNPLNQKHPSSCA